MAPPVGLRHSETLTVDPSVTVPGLPASLGDFTAMPPVFATACMIAFVEATCMAALAPHLAPGQRTVGTRVDVTHSAATPVGMRVTATVELIEAKGGRLRFQVACRDERDEIGVGFHERFIVDGAKFLARVAAKSRGAGV